MNLLFETEARALMTTLNGQVRADFHKNYSLSMGAMPIIQKALMIAAAAEKTPCKIGEIVLEGHKYCWRWSGPLQAWILSTHPKSPANNPEDFAIRIIEPTVRPS